MPLGKPYLLQPRYLFGCHGLARDVPGGGMKPRSRRFLPWRCWNRIDKGREVVFNNAMRMRFLFLLVSLAAASCSANRQTRMVGIDDLPLKSAKMPSNSWAESPLRANANYVLHGADSQKEKEKRIGDYYYVSWYDAAPEKPVRLVMLYTQAQTASQVQTLAMDVAAPRRGRAYRKARFFFAGEERKKKGDILSWRMELYVDGKLADSRQSFLWE